VFCVVLSFSSSADAATAKPVWSLAVVSQPTNLVPGAAAPQGFSILATNVGDASTRGEITLTDRLPAGLLLASHVEGCEAVGQQISCEFERVINAGESLFQFIPITISQTAAPVVVDVATVLGGEAEGAEARAETVIGAAPPAFGFLPSESGLEGALSSADGTPVAQAGSAPYELLANLSFPTELSGSGLLNAGHPRDVAIDLPPGFALDPAANPRCRDAQLGEGACPPASQVGLVGLSEAGPPSFGNVPLYNMVPPPGSASNLGFSVDGVSVPMLGSLRSGEYGFSAGASELLSMFPILGLQLQLWGDPSDPSHDAVRRAAVKSQTRPFITLPSACGPLELSAHMDSWEEPGSFISRSVPIKSPGGDPLEVEGCPGLAFEPAVSIQPTTVLADSPDGPQVTVEMPQHLGPEGSTTSSLRRATVTLPSSTVLNPAAAAGQATCSVSQIGLVSPVGQRDARFDGDPATCPDASKLGTVEALTPLLQDEPEEGVQRPHPLTGSIFLAQPHQNPFGSLFALYAVVEDPKTGIVVKLAGEVSTDPVTGQVTASFDEIPQLPFEEFKLDFFDGPGAVLRTPPLCGSYSSGAWMMPWSGTAPVQDESRFSISATPSGGACATAYGQLPNSPRFDAGSVLTTAGRYSPFVVNLSRGDGSQELGALEVTLPPGLIGKLAGSGRCPDSALSGNPSCPASSQVGRVAVTVGAGSSPYEAEGKVYLAGPYKGAPLSLAVVTPAVAGPFDLGTLVVRAAVTVDPTTGRLSIKSDPLPSMLAGVPLDIRSLRLEIDKPDLIRNPTSCEPMAITGSATSSIGQVAALSSRFQVGDCAALTFKPKLSLGLSGALGRGGHPALRAVLRTDPEGAALKSASFDLPAGELLDLKHVRALCSRKVAVGSCPSASRLGSVRIDSPSLEAPLEGPIYLRVPSHRLPDLVAEVRSEGFSFLLQGRATNSKGRLGVKLESLPDIPLSKAVLSLAGGRRGILVSSHTLCRGIGAVTANFGAHDGTVRRLRVRPHVQGC
jgi:hypothetical protein